MNIDSGLVLRFILKLMRLFADASYLRDQSISLLVIELTK